MPLYPRVDLKNPVVGAIHGYLKTKNKRGRFHISLNEEELKFLVHGAKAAGVPTATFVRAAALFGASMYLSERKKKDASETTPSGT